MICGSLFNIGLQLKPDLQFLESIWPVFCFNFLSSFLLNVSPLHLVDLYFSSHLKLSYGDEVGHRLLSAIF